MDIMRLTVKYETLNEENVNKLRNLLGGYEFNLSKIGEGLMLFIEADRDDMLIILEIATRFSYRDLMLRHS